MRTFFAIIVLLSINLLSSNAKEYGKVYVTDFVFILQDNLEYNINLSSFPDYISNDQDFKYKVKEMTIKTIKDKWGAKEIIFHEDRDFMFFASFFASVESGKEPALNSMVKGMKKKEEGKGNFWQPYYTPKFNKLYKNREGGADLYVSIVTKLQVNNFITPKGPKYQLLFAVKARNTEKKKNRVFKKNVKQNFHVITSQEYINAPEYITKDEFEKEFLALYPEAFIDKKQKKAESKSFTRNMFAQYKDFFENRDIKKYYVTSPAYPNFETDKPEFDILAKRGKKFKPYSVIKATDDDFRGIGNVGKKFSEANTKHSYYKIKNKLDKNTYRVEVILFPKSEDFNNWLNNKVKKAISGKELKNWDRTDEVIVRIDKADYPLKVNFKDIQYGTAMLSTYDIAGDIQGTVYKYSYGPSNAVIHEITMNGKLVALAQYAGYEVDKKQGKVYKRAVFVDLDVDEASIPKIFNFFVIASLYDNTVYWNSKNSGLF